MVGVPPWTTMAEVAAHEEQKTLQQIRVTRSPAATGKQLTVMRPKIETGLQPLGAAADVCPGGVKEYEAEQILARYEAEQKMLQIEDAEQLEHGADSLSDDSLLSDDDWTTGLEGVPLKGNWCTDGDY